MLSAIIEPVKLWAEGLIMAIGYPGIALLMMIDSANIPCPSEVIMPFGGMLAGQGKLNLHFVALSGTIGTVIGSGISYWVGALLGEDFLLKYGKYVLMRPKEIRHADRWFRRYGLTVTLWGRFIPLVRTFISLPAGIFRADFRIFLLYAFIGALPWCYVWTYIGFWLGKNWTVIEQNMKYADLVVVLVLVLLIAKFLRYRLRSGDSEDDADEAPAKSEAKL